MIQGNFMEIFLLNISVASAFAKMFEV